MTEEGKWEDDLDYEEYEIEEVELDRENRRWIAALEFGLRVQWARGGGMPQPRKGQTLRMFGVADEETDPRGMVLFIKEGVGRVVYYRDEIHHHLYLIEREVADEHFRRERYEQNKEVLSARLEDLVKPLRRRIEHLRNEAKDAEWWNAAYLEEELLISEHVDRLVFLIPEYVQLTNVFLGLPHAQKMSSVFAMLREQKKSVEGWAPPEGFVFHSDLTPGQVKHLRRVAEAAAHPESDQEMLNAVGVARPHPSADEMIASLPEEVRREALQESPD